MDSICRNGGKINTGLNDNITKFALINGDLKDNFIIKVILTMYTNGEFFKGVKNSFC